MTDAGWAGAAPLDEEDVERAILEGEPEPDEEPAIPPVDTGGAGARPQPEEAMGDEPEPEPDDVTAGPEEEALHVEDPVTEILDDELDLSELDVPVDLAEELEWRLAPEDDEVPPPPPAGAGTGVRPDDHLVVLMSAPPAVVGAEASLRDVAATLDARDIGALAVLAGGRLAGVVSERDVVRALAAGGDVHELRAADVMTEAPVRILGQATILAAAERMLEAGVRHLPVLGAQGQVLGVVSMRDVLRVLVEACRRA